MPTCIYTQIQEIFETEYSRHQRSESYVSFQSHDTGSLQDNVSVSSQQSYHSENQMNTIKNNDVAGQVSTSSKSSQQSNLHSNSDNENKNNDV